MSITLEVANDTVKLPVHVADGTRVDVVLPEDPDSACVSMGKPNQESRTEATPEELIEAARKEVAPAFAWMLEFAGSIDGLPEDFARNHDEYLSGRKKW